MLRIIRALMRLTLRLAYRLLYNEMAWTYDAVSWVVSLGQWRAWQRAALPYLRGRKVLEIAHGTGNMLLDLQALGFEPVGLDSSPAMGRITTRKQRSHGLHVPLLRARVQALPFAESAFPSLLSTFPAEFILDPAAHAEFLRVLQPGGVLVCVPSALFTGRALPDRLAALLFRLIGVTPDLPDEKFEPMLRPFRQAGFQARLERVALPRSVALVIVAEKQTANPKSQ